MRLFAARLARRIPSRVRSRAANLALLASSLVLSLLVLELVIRITYPVTGLYDYSPHVGYVLRPHQRVQFRAKEFNTTITTNSFGLRGEELDLERRERVLFLGDSFVFGHGVSDSQTFSTLLQERLDREPGAPQLVINAGTNGYDTGREYAFLVHHLARLEPDLIVLGFVINDPLSNSGEYFFSPIPQGLARHIPLRSVAVLLEYLRRPGKLLRKLGVRIGKAPVDHLTCLEPGSCEEAWSATLELLDQLKRAADSLGSELVIANLPVRQQIERVAADAHAVDSASALLRDFGRRRGVELVDLLESPLAVDDYYPVDGHWTPQGHSKVAEFLFQRLFVSRASHPMHVSGS